MGENSLFSSSLLSLSLCLRKEKLLFTARQPALLTAPDSFFFSRCSPMSPFTFFLRFGNRTTCIPEFVRLSVFSFAPLCPFQLTFDICCCLLHAYASAHIYMSRCIYLLSNTKKNPRMGHTIQSKDNDAVHDRLLSFSVQFINFRFLFQMN